MHAGLYPASGNWTTGYLGKSLSGDQGLYVGHMDHFQVFSYAKSTTMAQTLYQVRLMLTLTLTLILFVQLESCCLILTLKMSPCSLCPCSFPVVLT